MPTHYGFIVGSRLDSIEREYEKLLKTGPAKRNPPPKQPVYRMSAGLAARAKSVVEAMDSRGAWVPETEDEATFRELLDVPAFHRQDHGGARECDRDRGLELDALRVRGRQAHRQDRVVRQLAARHEVVARIVRRP